jgi:hypothetical protein
MPTTGLLACHEVKAKKRCLSESTERLPSNRTYSLIRTFCVLREGQRGYGIALESWGYTTAVTTFGEGGRGAEGQGWSLDKDRIGILHALGVIRVVYGELIIHCKMGLIANYIRRQLETEDEYANDLAVYW